MKEEHRLGRKEQPFPELGELPRFLTTSFPPFHAGALLLLSTLSSQVEIPHRDTPGIFEELPAHSHCRLSPSGLLTAIPLTGKKGTEEAYESAPWLGEPCNLVVETCVLLTRATDAPLSVGSAEFLH